MGRKTEELKSAYPKKKITASEVYFIDKRMLCSKSMIAKALNVTDRSVDGWVKKGLEYSSLSLPSFRLLDLDYVKEWYLDNIDQKTARSRGDVNVVPKPPEVIVSLEDNIADIEGKIQQANDMLQFKSTSIDSAERTEKILNALLKTVKLGKESGDLIPKRDTDKVVSEIVAVLIAGYKRDIKALPKECENRPWEEIQAILESTYRNNIEKLHKLSSMKSKKSMYDVLEVILARLDDGVTVDEMLERINT